MPDIFAQIEMPVFSPLYDPDTEYGYKKSQHKKNLQALLNKTSEGFCMYCYVRVAIDGKLWGHLEHSIEKKNSRYLTECVPNIAWACPVCNDVFKKQGERQRRIPPNDIEVFEHGLDCKSNHCKKECVKYKNLKKKYLKQKNAQMILQPQGVKGTDTGRDLRIQYNIQKAWFEPSTFQGEYSVAEKRFIECHINRFHLNDEKYRTNALMTFFEDVIGSDGYIIHTPENNLVVRIFKEKLKGLEKQDVLKICQKIYTYYRVKLRG